MLSAPISAVEIVIGYVGAAATKSVILGVVIALTARLFVSYEIVHPLTVEPWGVHRFHVRAPDGNVVNVVGHDS